MSNPAGVGQPAGNQDDNGITAPAYTLANFPTLTSSPASVGSASNQSISDLFDDEAEEAARQRRRTQAARGKRPSARGRQSLTGTATTTTQRLPAQRPRRPVNPPTPHHAARLLPTEVEAEVASLLSRQEAPSPPLLRESFQCASGRRGGQ